MRSSIPCASACSRLLGIPFAIAGGIVALYVSGLNFSISAAIGFVSLFGVSVMIGILMITNYNQARLRGEYAAGGHVLCRRDDHASAADDEPLRGHRSVTGGGLDRHRQRGAASARSGSGRRHAARLDHVAGRGARIPDAVSRAAISRSRSPKRHESRLQNPRLRAFWRSWLPHSSLPALWAPTSCGRAPLRRLVCGSAPARHRGRCAASRRRRAAVCFRDGYPGRVVDAVSLAGA